MQSLQDLNVIILAAGKGKRMISSTPKVLHKILDKPMIYYIINEVKKINPANIFVITGFAHETLESYLKDNFPEVKIIYQEKQLGTGHAILLTKRFYEENWGNVLVLSGDSPLIRSETLSRLVSQQLHGRYAASLITAILDNPFGYGRILRDQNGDIIKIVEESDASLEEKQIKEINPSIYCFNSKYLFENIENLKPQNFQREYYLTDIIEEFFKKNLKVSSLLVEDSTEILGINDRAQLAMVQKIMQKRINEKLMLEGVTIVDPDTTFISIDSQISNDVVVQPNTFIYGKTVIKKDCNIGPFVQLMDCEIDEGTLINSAVLVNAIIGKNNNIGPFSYVRPGTITKTKVKIGGFCEVKKSIINNNSKIPHLTYIGDSEIGENVNIGASSVTCNYDGFRKNKTIIGDNVFVGSDTMFVPPIKIGSGSLIAAGSVITEDVPDNSLAITRGKQINIQNGATKYRKKKSELKDEGV
jgi:bifunctional UDP-N-acetylglucosamine pyrophosphorylase/glucosamine-1-phosphate N-acetyltransferase